MKRKKRQSILCFFQHHHAVFRAFPLMDVYYHHPVTKKQTYFEINDYLYHSHVGYFYLKIIITTAELITDCASNTMK